jgi:hypothetical protein
MSSNTGFSLALAVGVKVRLFSLRSDSPAVSETNIKIVKDGIMEGNSVVPDSDSVLFPLETDLEVDTTGNVSIQEVQDSFRFSLANTNNAAGESRLNEQALPSSDRMSTNNRVDGFNGSATDSVASSESSIALIQTRVDSFQAFNELLESWRQSIVCSIARCPEGVTSNSWESIKLQEGKTCGILKYCHTK